MNFNIPNEETRNAQIIKYARFAHPKYSPDCCRYCGVKYEDCQCDYDRYVEKDYAFSECHSCQNESYVNFDKKCHNFCHNYWFCLECGSSCENFMREYGLNINKFDGEYEHILQKFIHQEYSHIYDFFDSILAAKTMTSVRGSAFECLPRELNMLIRYNIITHS